MMPGRSDFTRLWIFSNKAFQLVMLILWPCLTLSCATPQWEHPMHGVQRLEEDRADCRQQATVELMQIDPHSGAAFDKQEAVNRCLTRKGYSRRPPD
jgi:hypothetical protein